MDRGDWRARYSPWGHKELDMTERLTAHIPELYPSIITLII